LSESTKYISTNKMNSITLIAVMMMGSADLAYRISYFDWLNPKNVKRMDAAKVCKNNNDKKLSK